MLSSETAPWRNTLPPKPSFWRSQNLRICPCCCPFSQILRSVHFTQSKRYPALLSYVVQRTLDGQSADLKERTLGIEVFHRRPDYDNNDDTIVRVENFVVIVGGIGKNGTEAATQFVTSARYLDLLDRPESKDWASKNLEVVIRTKVIDGRAGPPTIEAVTIW